MNVPPPIKRNSCVRELLLEIRRCSSIIHQNKISIKPLRTTNNNGKFKSYRYLFHFVSCTNVA